jgi:hypothetical protein
MDLTVKELKFIEAYIETGNRTEAVIRAGYKAGNRQRASEIGYQLLQKTPVLEAVRIRLTEAVMSPEEVKSRLSDIARGSIEDFVNFQDGLRLPILDLRKARDNGKLHLIKKLKYTKDGAIEFELYPADAAQRDMGKIHGIFKDTATNLNVDVSQLTNEQLERIANGEDLLNVLANTGEGGA